MRYLVTILTLLLPFQSSYLTVSYNNEVGVEAHISQVSVTDFTKRPGKLKKVVLDAGHGGRDHGCTVAPHREKEIALKITLELGRIIENQYPEVEVIYTRKTDVFVPLYKRIRMANENNADLFISIHCNYSEFPKVKGSESYVMGLHTAAENLNVAKRENSAVLHEVDFEKNYDGYNPNSPAGHIILSMYQNAYLDHSISLAQKVEYCFNNIEKVKSRGVKQAGFVVLKKAAMPSVLIECGYLSNIEDAKRLATVEGQADAAKSIFKAFKTYKNEVERIRDHAVTYVPQPKEKEPEPFKEIKKEDLKKQVAQPKAKIKKPYKVPAKSHIKNFIQENETPSSRLVYKVQIAASNGKPLAKNGMKWQQLSKIEVKIENNMYKYLIGNLSTLELALQKQREMRTLGFNGAFIVAYDGEERIGLKKAKEIASKKNNL